MAAHVVCYDPSQDFSQPDTDDGPFPCCCCGGIPGAGLLNFPRKAGEGEMSGNSFGPWESMGVGLGIGANDKVGIGSPRIDDGDPAREMGDMGGDLEVDGLGCTRRRIGNTGDNGC